MPLRPFALTALIFAAGLGLAACDEPSVQPNQVGSGDGPTDGEGSFSPGEGGTPPPGDVTPVPPAPQ